MNKRYCICIPLYKQTLYDYEQLSLLRILDFCVQFNKINNLFFIIPNSMKINFNIFIDTYIDKFIKDIYNMSYIFNIMTYEDTSLTSVNSYNNMLMLNKNFYGDFCDEYDYMLIYQLDGYIFDDNLDYFLNKEYDYIGGYYIPFYSDTLCYGDINNHKFIMNGGVCLKKIKFCIDTIENNYDEILHGCEFNNTYRYLNEDSFFSYVSNSNVTVLDSIKFSLNWLGAESNWAINNFEYPFCCHGINKNKFLMKLIEKYNEEHNLNYKYYIK